jgi:outer membrane protein OmpA-like peptidoglycan-associated protein
MKKFFLLTIFIYFTILSFSQNTNSKKDSTNNYASWIYGVGLNVVNDNSIWAQSYFDLKKTWSFNWQTLNIDRHFIGGFYLNAMVSKTLFISSIRRDTYYPEAGTNFFSTDLNLKYTFKKIFPTNFWAEPYAYAGYGLIFQRNTFNDKSFITHNLSNNIGIGTYIWIDNHWGLNFQASSKWSLKTNANYKQNVIGIVYRIGVKRVKSKSVKNPMLYENSIDDSLRIACNCDIDLTKIKANNGLDKNKNIITGTGNVVDGLVVNMFNSNNQTNNDKGITPVVTSFIIYFDFDKYSLTPKSITTLEEVLSYLKIYPKSRVLLNGHTDLHGSINYNFTLSFKRVEATKDYLIMRYVNPFTISTKFESKLNPIINIMDDNVNHFNRRVEIVILNQ